MVATLCWALADQRRCRLQYREKTAPLGQFTRCLAPRSLDIPGCGLGLLQPLRTGLIRCAQAVPTMPYISRLDGEYTH